MPPDLAPLMSLVDDTFPHFAKGTLSESGAKIYVSAKGNVQLLDRRDLNGDGWLDVVFSNVGKSSLKTANAYVYWGSAAGISVASRLELPAKRSASNAIADLNDDGYPDLFLANYSDGSSHKTNSYIYWGQKGGKFSTLSLTQLPTIGAWGVAVADVNKDGYLDIVVGNSFDGKTNNISSSIFWGSPAGFKAATHLPTVGATGVTVADLDRDGQLDLVFANSGMGGMGKVNSYIYWGKKGGVFSNTARSGLPTNTADDVSAADLNNDGQLDLVFSNRGGIKGAINSYIYWGNKGSYTSKVRTELPTRRATGNSVADLNGDGRLDIVFSNYGEAGKPTNSYIYWGTKVGFTTLKRDQLPTHRPMGNMLLDLDADGQMDIVSCDSTDLTNSSSTIYWGSGGSFSKANTTKLPTLTPHHSTIADVGSVYTRGPAQTFTSRVFFAAAAAPKYESLSWKAKVPKKTKLELQLRSANSAAGLSVATWYGPTSTADHYVSSTKSSVNKVHQGHRYIQYRAVLSSQFGDTPVLDRVTITYR